MSSLIAVLALLWVRSPAYAESASEVSIVFRVLAYDSDLKARHDKVVIVAIAHRPGDSGGCAQMVEASGQRGDLCGNARQIRALTLFDGNCIRIHRRGRRRRGQLRLLGSRGRRRRHLRCKPQERDAHALHARDGGPCWAECGYCDSRGAAPTSRQLAGDACRRRPPLPCAPASRRGDSVSGRGRCCASGAIANGR
jgi:hypothetical protein